MVQLAQEGMTMMAVTHETGLARKVASRVVFMDKGCIIEDCVKDGFFGMRCSRRAKDFLQKINHRSVPNVSSLVQRERFARLSRECRSVKRLSASSSLTKVGP